MDPHIGEAMLGTRRKRRGRFTPHAFVSAQSGAAGQAIAAAATNTCPSPYDLTGKKVLHIGTDLDNFPDELRARQPLAPE